jgi:hypothetical protein
MDKLHCEDEILRAVVTALLVAYYRSRPSDTRAALAALPAEHRTMASAQLNHLIEAAKKQARQAEAERPAGGATAAA